MSPRKSPSRHRVGKVSYYQHHGSWYLYFRDPTGAHRIRIGRSEAEAERAAALKNAELLSTPAAAEPSLPIGAFRPPVDLDRRKLLTGLAALLGSPVVPDPAQDKIQPALRYPIVMGEATPPVPIFPIGQLRTEFLDHHEHVVGSSLATVKRYAAATQHLLNFAAQEKVEQAAAISGDRFTRYLRTTDVAPNGHANARRKRLSDKSICFTLQTCGAMYRFACERGQLPKTFDNPFKKLAAHKFKIRSAKPIFIFDEPTEQAFFKAADPWAFAVHFTLAMTGLRPGELVHALIEDLDLDEGWLRVREKRELGWEIKAGGDRNDPLAPEVCQVLRHTIGERRRGLLFLRMKLGPGDPPQLVGDRSYLAAVVSQRLEQRRATIGRALTRREEATVHSGVWRDAGAIPNDRVRTSFIGIAKKISINATCPKSWRHTFATLLQEANVDPLIRQLTLG